MLIVFLLSIINMSLAQLSAKNQQFFKTGLKAVVGASTDRSKFGNKVLRCYQEHSFACVPVNKRSKKIEGLATVER
jgi:predicted CoA-binding protein